MFLFSGNYTNVFFEVNKNKNSINCEFLFSGDNNGVCYRVLTKKNVSTGLNYTNLHKRYNFN